MPKKGIPFFSGDKLVMGWAEKSILLDLLGFKAIQTVFESHRLRFF